MLVRWTDEEETAYVEVQQLRDWCREATGSEAAYTQMLRRMGGSQ